jgi:hypothetical protein
MAKKQSNSPKKLNLNCHAAHCTVCLHSRRDEIETAFISWASPTKIAADYKLGNRSALYRHAAALDLNSKRSKNIHAALDRYIERVDDAPVTGSAIIQAIGLRARMNSRGEILSRDEQVGANEIFDKMNPQELEDYAKRGQLPTWCGGAPIPQIQEKSEGNKND